MTMRYKCRLSQAVVAHTFNPSTWEAEAGRFLSSRTAWLQSEFQVSQGYTEKPCLGKPNNNNNDNNNNNNNSNNNKM